jgi:uncharacterized lipoprotein YajG
MKRLFVFAPAALLMLAGCATDPNAQYAKADCKVAPLSSSFGAPKPVSTLAQRQAEMDLASSGYRMRNLNRPGFNNVEEALRDCY